MVEPPEDKPEAPDQAVADAGNPWLPPELRQAATPGQAAAERPAREAPERNFSPPPAEPFAGPSPEPVQPPGGSAAPPAKLSPPPAPVRRSRRLSLPRPRRPSPGPRRPGAGRRYAWLVAVVAAIAVVGGVIVVAGGPKKEKADSSPPAAYRQLTTPFTVNGARFEVQPANDARWAVKMRSERAERVGKRWVSVQIPVRNLSRVDLRPRGLGYRLLTPSGLVVGPEVVEVLSGSLDSEGRLAKGKLSSVHLGFRVPESAKDLTLAFDAGGIREASVRALLGAEG